MLEVHVVDGDTGDVLLLRVVHDRLARCEQTLGVGVPGAVRKIANHVLHNLVGWFEAEGGEIADVQFDDLLTLVFHLACAIEHRTSNVVSDIGKLGGLLDWLHWSPR